MAAPTPLPSATMDDFELPPSADAAAQNNKEVSWSATPGEIDQETIEKLKRRITYEIDTTMAVKVVLKETYRQFKTTDPKLLFVSAADPSLILRTADDFDRIPLADFPKFFPAEVKNGKTWLSLFLVSEMAVGKLKRTAVGFYQYSAKKVWIQESSSFTSTNAQKIGFFVLI